MKKNSFKLVELALYYIVIFFILREWLIPIMELTKTGFIGLILLFVAISLLLSLFRIHFIISWVVKIAYITWFITFIYGGVFFFSTEGMYFIIDDLQVNFAALLQGDWLGITNPFRTFLFFILIWMLVYLIHHWITVRMSIFYFLILTVFFIATLDTFTQYDGSFAIVKVMLLGLLITSLLFLKRLVIQSNSKINLIKYTKLMAPVVVLIGVISIIAVLLPKSPPQWPDPIPFIQSATGQGEGIEGEGNGISKVGYGENDSRLGGSFVADDTVVFLVESETKQYWRVETKDIYTSKGWEQSNYFDGELLNFAPDETIRHSLPVGPEENTNMATVQVLYPYNFIIQPYGMKSVDIDVPNFDNQTVELMMERNTEKMQVLVNRGVVQLNEFTVQYSKPVYLYSELQNPTEQIDASITERYLQLPETLPDRVRELAAEIVEGRETPYDQARAIELYFRQSGFRYDTEDVAVPSEEQDYVDQFLFETRVGYCDNFSTAMVVLLRSVGIPARWVKGFAGGDVVDNNGSMSTYEITNNHAHSWVEAYIPNVGWVNFEPTIGFNSTRSIDFDIETDVEQQDELVAEEETEPTEVIEEEREEQQQSASQGNTWFTNVKEMFEQIKLFVIALIVLLIVGAVLLYKWRGKWWPKVYVKLQRQKKIDESTFESFYLNLLKLLEMKGFKRKEGQTLEAYAKDVDMYYETYHMTNITKAYEQFIYAKNSTNIDFDKMRESWEYLINRTTS
ncbi:transglutaminase domain-containing protein [Lysinibacillus halotolerans]